MIFAIGFENGKKLLGRYVVSLVAIEDNVKFDIVNRPEALEANINLLKGLEREGKITIYTSLSKVPMTQEELPVLKNEAVKGLIAQAEKEGKKASSVFVETGALLIDTELQKLKVVPRNSEREITVAEMITENQYRKLWGIGESTDKETLQFIDSHYDHYDAAKCSGCAMIRQSVINLTYPNRNRIKALLSQCLK